MGLDGEQGVVEHYLMDVKTRGRTELTILGYKQRLFVLVHLLADLCKVTDLEQVTILSLRQCVQHLMTVGSSYLLIK